MCVLVAVKQFGQIGSKHRGAAGLQHHHRCARPQRRTQRRKSAAQNEFGNPKLAGGDPGQPAAHGSARDFVQHRDGGLTDVGFEVIDEGIGPEHDTPRCDAVAAGGWRENQLVNLSSAKCGSSRWASIPPALLTSSDSSAACVAALSARGITAASRAHSGIQPMSSAPSAAAGVDSDGTGTPPYMVAMSTSTGQSLRQPLQARHRSSASWTSVERHPSVMTSPCTISNSSRARPRVDCSSSPVAR